MKVREELAFERPYSPHFVIHCFAIETARQFVFTAGSSMTATAMHMAVTDSKAPSTPRADRYRIISPHKPTLAMVASTIPAASDNYH
jgi:hypothetical protein